MPKLLDRCLASLSWQCRSRASWDWLNLFLDFLLRSWSIIVYRLHTLQDMRLSDISASLWLWCLQMARVLRKILTRVWALNLSQVGLRSTIFSCSLRAAGSRAVRLGKHLGKISTPIPPRVYFSTRTFTRTGKHRRRSWRVVSDSLSHLFRVSRFPIPDAVISREGGIKHTPKREPDSGWCTGWRRAHEQSCLALEHHPWHNTQLQLAFFLALLYSNRISEFSGILLEIAFGIPESHFRGRWSWYVGLWWQITDCGGNRWKTADFCRN